METLEILFITLPVIVLLSAVGIFFSLKKDKEYTINVKLQEPEEQHDGPAIPEPVAKPKRRYKKRKKKVVTPPVVEVIPAVKKKPGRPKKTN